MAVGNTFSGTSYFKAIEIKGDSVITKCKDKNITVSRDILDYEMYNASVYATEERITLT